MLIPVIIAVAFLVYALMDLAPGDLISGMNLEKLSEAEIEELRVVMGLNDPLIVRFGNYMFRLIKGDLGVSDVSGISVWASFTSRLPNTLVLAFSAVAIGTVVSIPLGVFAARRAGKIMDNITTTLSVFGMSIPGFFVGILLILVFSFHLRWFPSGGFKDGVRSVVLPAITSSLVLIASSARQTRSSMLEVLKSDFLRTARAKGVPENVIIRKHALGNALIPIVTTIGLNLGHTIAGTAVIETVFSWPGIGRLVVESISSRDVTTTTGVVVLTTGMYVLVQLIVDIIYAIIDPRVKAQFVNKAKKKKHVSKRSSELLLAKKQIITLAEQTGVENDSTVNTDASSDDDFPLEVTLLQASTVISDQDSEKRASADFISNADAVIANDEPVIKKYRKHSRIGEVFHHLSRNMGAVVGLVLVALLLILFVVSLFIPFSKIIEANIPDRFSAPSLTYIFGTDGMGRDLFIRVIYATRFSLPIGFGATALASIIGVFLGSFASYYDGTATDEVIMRFSDVLGSIPGVLLGMVIITTLGRSLTNLIIAVGVACIPGFIRISRASTLSVKSNEFVEASRAIGLPNFRIIFSQILPNGLAPIIVAFTTQLGMSILISATLSFLGFGIPAPNPEWGSLAAIGRDNIRDAPWLTTFPGLFIMITVMAFNLLGDGLRDAFDPKLKKR